MKSQRLRLKDLREIYRLVGECRELGGDWQVWRAHMLLRLGQVLGARSALSVDIEHLNTSREQINTAVPYGFDDAADRARWEHYRTSGSQLDDPFHLGYFHRFTGQLRTRRLLEVVEATDWYRCRHYGDYVAACRLDGRITSSLRLASRNGASGPIHCLVVHRAAGEGQFDRRAARLVHLFHHELGPLMGASLALPDAATPSANDLPPRLRQVLRLLLHGRSEKQAAVELGLSPHTISRHVRRLHERFQVESRGELLHAARGLLPALQREDSAASSDRTVT